MRMDKLTNQLQLALADAQSLALGKEHTGREDGPRVTALIFLLKTRRRDKYGQFSKS